jgi:glycosyltransferase involved in cell wall biosynthesis
MRVGLIFHKNPLAIPTGIDLVRLRAMAFGLNKRGVNVDIIAPVSEPSLMDGVIPVLAPSALSKTGRYDAVKTCYHFSIKLIGDYSGPVVSRIVRVVDGQLPVRDALRREELLQCQDMIFRRASLLVLNNRVNEERWRRLYGDSPPITLIPTGCSRDIPPIRFNPYSSGEKVMLFLGSVASTRMVRLLNDAAQSLQGRCAVHMVGANKTRLYGGNEYDRLCPEIVQHGEMREEEIWDFIRCAHIGLALATGPDAFDNDLSKIYSYLRGGLPVLSEERVVNNSLVLESGLGAIFRFGDPLALASKAIALLDFQPIYNQESTMAWMSKEHSWDRRVEVLNNLFDTLSEHSPLSCNR